MCDERYLAIDIGGTSIKYILTDRNAEISKINEMKTDRDDGELFTSLDEIIAPHLNDIDGIALSFPGKINVEKGIAHTAGAFRWICDLEVKSILEKKYLKHVWIENDGKCGALAEFWKGNLSDVKNGVFIGLGTEIAGGIILEGKLFRGSFGSSGEFSSMLGCLKNPDNEERFGKIGGYKNLIGNCGSDGHEFFEKYHAGDVGAENALKEYSRTIAAGIVNIQSVLDVEKFCIGGGISAEDVVIDEIRESLREFITVKLGEAISEPAIEKCRFGNASGCVGALYNFLCMEKII
ncbi:MAG: ROK family protein [Methanobrevibacter sp.]|uniref:ROK family protein n=1 Tax=Methanobrevibacter sp. TaxID=66852 RepID=UPI0025E77764|nr:ROK family protein [Methanobrevibacter sp.]MBQ6099327.1 ROK family protein [Methanobrevibacter sp.]